MPDATPVPPNVWQALFLPSSRSLQFALKNMIAGALALYLALRFNLEQPQWALTTVFVVNQPISGMVLAKSAFRLLGTLIGAIISIVLISLFAQTPLLFLLAMALWLAFCTAGAMLLRNHAAYGFVLAGYTTAIVALPATVDPVHVFDQAVARFTELSVGILCASVISTLLWPRTLSQGLAAQGRATRQTALRAAASEMSGDDQHKSMIEAFASIAAVDAQRDHAWFEGPMGRRRSQSLSVLSRDLLSLLRASRGVARQFSLLDSAASRIVSPLIGQVASTLQQGIAQDLHGLSLRLDDALSLKGLSPEGHTCLLRLALVLRLCRQSGQTLEALEQGQVAHQAPGTLSWHRDVERAVLSGLRSALAFLLVAAFWLSTAWTSGLASVSISGVVLSLFAGRENPAASSANFLKGIIFSIPVAGFVSLALLPAWDGFPLLCLGLGVPLFLASLYIPDPRFAPVASAFCIFFVNNVGPANVMTYDLASFINKVLGTVLGAGVSVLVLHLVPLTRGERYCRSLVAASLVDLAELTSRPLLQAESWFGGRMLDRLISLARYYQALAENQRGQWRSGLSGLDLGDELLHMRLCLASAQGVIATERDHYLQYIALALDAGWPSAEREHLLDAPAAALLKALNENAMASSTTQEMAIAAVLQLQNIWHQRCRQDEPSPL